MACFTFSVSISSILYSVRLIGAQPHPSIQNPPASLPEQFPPKFPPPNNHPPPPPKEKLQLQIRSFISTASAMHCITLNL
ncbi:hypothetical protein GGR50DRAFT_683686, partial [Xylaria sp. CBS 124048]